ncbi:MAG: ABC transporter substrate-binding protein, partial [Pseudomonadota bacterium]
MTKQTKTISRRIFLASGAATLAAPAILRSSRAYAQNPTLKIGHISPRSGPLAAFAEADEFVLKAITE